MISTAQHWLYRRLASNGLKTPLMTLLMYALTNTSAHALTFSSCSVSMSAIAFGVYNPLSSSDNNGTATVTVTCNIAAAGGNNAISALLSLNKGSSTTYSPRTLVSGTNPMNYNVYTAANYNTVWGDGTGSSATVSATFSSKGDGQQQTFTLYGKIPKYQYNVVPGSYSDTLTVTLTY